MALRRRKRKATRFRKVEFKLTYQQKKRVDAFCNHHKTTPVNMYKKAILLYLDHNGYGQHRIHQPAISENQMSIFDIVGDPLKAED